MVRLNSFCKESEFLTSSVACVSPHTHKSWRIIARPFTFILQLIIKGRYLYWDCLSYVVFDGIESVQLPGSIESARFVWFSIAGVRGAAGAGGSPRPENGTGDSSTKAPGFMKTRIRRGKGSLPYCSGLQAWPDRVKAYTSHALPLLLFEAWFKEDWIWICAFFHAIIRSNIIILDWI